MVERTAWPELASLRKKATMAHDDCESRPEVGSSRNSNRAGLAASSTPIVNSCRRSQHFGVENDAFTGPWPFPTRD